REVLLRAKEIAEREGFHLVHANVDCLFLKKGGATEHDFKAIVSQVERETNFPMSFDGIYKWLRFVPSKRDERNGVPNKYFGCFADGELKLRGIELRRHDTPVIFREFQKELLARLHRANGIADCRQAGADLFEIYRSYQERLRSCAVPARDLAFSSQLSKDP